MSDEPKGSKPGSIEDTQLDRVNTYPSVEFAIPTSAPISRVVSKCPSHPTASGGIQEKSVVNEGSHGTRSDEETQSVIPPDEHSYPEGGLQAWLVVLASFMGSIVAFGVM